VLVFVFLANNGLGSGLNNLEQRWLSQYNGMCLLQTLTNRCAAQLHTVARNYTRNLSFCQQQFSGVVRTIGRL
jgi:hypothetical protein